MKRVIWQPAAIEDQREAITYIADRDVRAARSWQRKIDSAVMRLARHPTGRPGRNEGVFEKPVPGTFYTIAYATTMNELHVLRLVHQRRDWQGGAWPSD